MAQSKAPIIKSKSSNELPMDSETLPISESGYCLHFLTPTSPLTGRTYKQPVPRFRHELLNKTYSIFSSVLLDEEPKECAGKLGQLACPHTLFVSYFFSTKYLAKFFCETMLIRFSKSQRIRFISLA